MSKYIMAIDQGTTSSRCVIFDKTGGILCKAQKPFAQYYPKEGWVEQNPDEIWLSQLSVCGEALYKLGASAGDIAAIGITNQRETVVVWDKQTGVPVYNAIVWQCRRTADFCAELKRGGHQKMITEKTGLTADAYFSASKIAWILENADGAKEKADNGELLFGTIDTFLLWKLTAGKVHATDYTNASRTMLFNIHTLKWDDELLSLFGIPRSMLPEVFPSIHAFGETRLFGAPIKIAGIAGDQQASMFGQRCFKKGMVKNTYGTGCFILMHTGTDPIASDCGLLTTVACGGSGKPCYALEGSVFIAGALINWLRDELKLIDSSEISEYYANLTPDTNGVYIVPAFVGLGAPYWDPYARGIITGLTRGVKKEHIVRAALEAIAYQSYDIIKAMEKNSGIGVELLKVDGGASANNFLMQFQSDILGVCLEREKTIECTALGAAMLAGLEAGVFKNIEELSAVGEADRFKPGFLENKADSLIKGWHSAVSKALS